jgi:hypothetical protein
MDRPIRYSSGTGSSNAAQGQAHQIQYRYRLIKYSTGTGSSDTLQGLTLMIQYRDMLIR